MYRTLSNNWILKAGSQQYVPNNYNPYTQKLVSLYKYEFPKMLHSSSALSDVTFVRRGPRK